jgi:outer membrane protein TolC
MSRQTNSRVAWLMLALISFSGCHPTQPFYLQSDGDLSHYLDKATEMEYPDVHAESLPDTVQSLSPMTVSNPDFQEIWDLSLEECVTIALQNSKTVRNLGGVTPFGFADALVERTGGSATVFDPAIQASSIGSGRPALEQAGGVEAALAAFDAQFSMVGSGGAGTIWSRVDRPRNAGTNPFFPVAQDQDIGGLRTSITKPTANGSRFTLTNQTDYERFNNDTRGFAALNSDWTTTVEVRWDQPLLRGRGTMVNRIPIVLARINEDISLTQFESSVRNLVLDIENTYLDLHRSYRNLETAKTGRDSAQVTWKIVYEKWNEGVEPVQAEAQAREQYFNFRAGVERSLQDLYNTETRLRWLMGLAATDGRLIRPIDEPTMARVAFDWSAIRTETLVRSPELRQKKWVVKARELEIIAAKNNLLPQLDVGALYRWVGKGDDLIHANRNGLNYPQEGSTAVEGLTGGNYQEAALVFNFAMPVGFRREMAGVRNAQLRLAREKAQLEDQELNAIHLLSTAYRNVDGFYTQAETHFNRWSAAEKEVESVNALYRGGKQTVDLVLEAQRRRADAQISYYNALVDYNKAIAEVHFRKGSLLEYNNIELAEGNWPQKAYWDALGLARQRDASYYLNYGWTRPDVVSQGPVDQGIGRGMTIEGHAPAEVIPAPEPTPADDQTAPLPVPMPDAGPAPKSPPAGELGPVTGGPAMPALNAPIVHATASVRSDRPLDNPLRNGSNSAGMLGMDSLRPGMPAQAVSSTNRLRSAGSENAMPVQPAGYTAQIHDGADSGR